MTESAPENKSSKSSPGGGRHQQLLDELHRVVNTAIEGTELELVDLTLRGNSQKRILRIDIDRAGPKGISLEDCQTASHGIGALLEEHDPIGGAYTLEVGSPGIERPIRSQDDLRRNVGRFVKIEPSEPVEETSEYRGHLTGYTEENIELKTKEGVTISLPWSQVSQAQQDIDI